MRTTTPWVLCLLLCGAACGDKKTCKLNSDCSEVERCVSNTCTVLCRTDRDCRLSEVCTQGQCGLAPLGGGFVSATGGGVSGTGGGSSGGASAGGAAGGSSDGGGAGGASAGGAAGGASAGGTSGGSSAGGAAGGASAGGAAGGASAGGAAGGSVVDAGAPPDAGSGLGRRGDPCARGSDCQSNLCVGPPGGTQGACTDSCLTEASCLEREMCLQVPNGMGGTTGLCIPSDSGAPCPTGQPTPCAGGICLVHPAGVSQSICTTSCQSSRACPLGFSCSLTQIGASTQQVCTPIGTACSGAGMSNQCISRWCITSAATPNAGECSASCTVATDCPTGYACGFDDTPSGIVDRCHPIGLACTVTGAGINSCSSRTCLQGTPSGDYCTTFCMTPTLQAAPARCPTGWSCVNEGTAGQPAWVCER